MKEKECTVPGRGEGGGTPNKQKKWQKLILGKTDPGLQSITEKANHRNSRTGRYLTQDSRQMNSHISSQNSTLNYFSPHSSFLPFCRMLNPSLQESWQLHFIRLHPHLNPPSSPVSVKAQNFMKRHGHTLPLAYSAMGTGT